MFSSLRMLLFLFSWSQMIVLTRGFRFLATTTTRSQQRLPQKLHLSLSPSVAVRVSSLSLAASPRSNCWKNRQGSLLSSSPGSFLSSPRASSSSSCRDFFSLDASSQTVEENNNLTTDYPNINAGDGNKTGNSKKRRKKKRAVVWPKTVILKRSNQSKAFRNGSQLVFTRAISKVKVEDTSISRTLQTGDLVQVLVEGDDKTKGRQKKTNNYGKDNNNNNKHQQTPSKVTPDSAAPVPIGFGVYNPDSLYKIRILCHNHLQPTLYKKCCSLLNDDTNNSVKEDVSIRALRYILEHHFEKALQLRRDGLQLPTTINDDSGGKKENTRVKIPITDTYRLVQGEGDGLSGLAVDILGADGVAVIMSSAAWCEVHRDTILEALQQILPNHELVWKTTASRLKQDGYHKEENSISDDSTPLKSAKEEEESREVICIENGIRYRTFPFQDGQKTGFYCDQRQNKWNVGLKSHGKRVLDLCCYHGGFALNAVVNGGAAYALGVDSSQEAVIAATANAVLNNCQDRTKFLRSDITPFLQDYFSTKTAEDMFDVVILDPPKLAPTVAGLEKARRKYHALNRDAIKVVHPFSGGLLLTCTCSAAMTQKDGGQYFLNMVHGAALASGRQVTLLSRSGAASCHTLSPISWPAGAYLTAALFYVHPE